jgi:hypothetical protein
MGLSVEVFERVEFASHLVVIANSNASSSAVIGQGRVGSACITSAARKWWTIGRHIVVMLFDEGFHANSADCVQERTPSSA